MGLDYERDDDQYIKEAIKTIESRFDLVLITDRFEESVILLKGTDLEVVGSNVTTEIPVFFNGLFKISIRYALYEIRRYNIFEIKSSSKRRSNLT